MVIIFPIKPSFEAEMSNKIYRKLTFLMDFCQILARRRSSDDRVGEVNNFDGQFGGQGKTRPKNRFDRP